jgi:Mn-dependent DtxR family transcriptional regulator
LSLRPKTIAIRPAAGYNARVQTKRKPARQPLPAPSDSTEDHLERIAELMDHKGYARVSDVAEELGLTLSTVSNMVRRLAARGFLNYEKYRGFSLTSEGRAVAARIKARHETLAELFGLLGLEPETVEQEVEDIEHHLRPQTLDMLARLVSYWKAQPEQLQAFLRFARRK